VRIELFKSDGDATGYAKARTYLTYNSNWFNGNFDTTVTVSGLPVVTLITATATDALTIRRNSGPNYTLGLVYYSKGSLAVNTASKLEYCPQRHRIERLSFGNGNVFIIQNATYLTLSGSTSWKSVQQDFWRFEKTEVHGTNTSTGTVTMGTFSKIDNRRTYSHGSQPPCPALRNLFAASVL